MKRAVRVDDVVRWRPVKYKGLKRPRYAVTELNTTLCPGHTLVFGYRYDPREGSIRGLKRMITQVKADGSINPYRIVSRRMWADV